MYTLWKFRYSYFHLNIWDPKFRLRLILTIQFSCHARINPLPGCKTPRPSILPPGYFEFSLRRIFFPLLIEVTTPPNLFEVRKLTNFVTKWLPTQQRDGIGRCKSYKSIVQHCCDHTCAIPALADELVTSYNRSQIFENLDFLPKNVQKIRRLLFSLFLNFPWSIIDAVVFFWHCLHHLRLWFHLNTSCIPIFMGIHLRFQCFFYQFFAKFDHPIFGHMLNFQRKPSMPSCSSHSVVQHIKFPSLYG